MHGDGLEREPQLGDEHEHAEEHPRTHRKELDKTQRIRETGKLYCSTLTIILTR